MGQRPVEFADDEWYHCYSRSIDRQPVFKDPADYQRFIQSLYLANGNRRLLRGALYRPSHEHLLSLKRGSPLVSIGAYCLMPNHFHLLIRQVSEKGISSFMQKLGTSYSMYYNTKYQHIGNVFIKPFRAKHIEKDDYFQHVVQYIHLNPVEIFEPQWKQAKVRDMKGLGAKLRGYRYSSFQDHAGIERPENSIVDASVFGLVSERPIAERMLHEAAEYYQELNL